MQTRLAEKFRKAQESSKSELRVFEESLPFAQTDVKFFISLLQKAERHDANDGFVTISALRYNLNSYIWRPLHDDSSSLTKMI